jgi:hypothetical protein
MESDEQLNLWLEGIPKHNTTRGECCPDFSCCRPELLAPREVREIFVAAQRSGNDRVTDRLLMEFLCRALADKNVYIAGLEASRQEVE